MAEVASPIMHQHTTPRDVPLQGAKLGPPFENRVLHQLRHGLANLDTTNPVNQNGSYESDRVIKSGEVLKRTRKTKTWKTIYLVLRPNLLSIYRDKEETKLRHQIAPSDLTAIARQKDPKRKAEYVFGLFSPSRNYHLAATSEKEAQQWVELIRSEARIDEEEEEMLLASPTTGIKHVFRGFDRGRHLDFGREVLSSSSDGEHGKQSVMASGTKQTPRRPSHALSYSGNEYGSYSDFSDAGGFWQQSNASLPQPANVEATKNGAGADVPKSHIPDNERVACQGWIFILKSTGGVRQWKKLWVVLRPKSMAFYKTNDEYSANLIIPLPSIIDAVEIDAVSKSKRHCMQIITEERNYRFCARDEDSLANWLGALKCLLAKRREATLPRPSAAAASSTNHLAPQSTTTQQ